MNANIEELTNMFTNATEEQRQRIVEMMSNMNVNNRNNDKTEKHAKKILKKKNEKRTSYVKFLESKSINGLIWAPTQVGKSAATRVFVLNTTLLLSYQLITRLINKNNSEDEEENRMEKLIDMWWGKKTIIGKILSYIYENEGADEEDLKEFIEECGSKDAKKMYHHLISKTKEYKLVFKRKNNITNLNKEAREYIDNME